MAQKKKQYTAAFKIKVVLEILKGEKTASQISGDVGVHPVVLAQWKRQFLEMSPQIFEKSRKSKRASEEKEKAELFEQIGRLKMENEWLKKKFSTLT